MTLNVPLFIPAFVFAVACGPTPSSTANPSSAPSHGEMVFTEHCESCHPGARWLREQETRTAHARDVIRLGAGRMPAFDAALIPESDLDELIVYLRRMGMFRRE